MKEDLLRHALTASLAGLLASFGTAALVGGGGAAPIVRPASPPARRDAIDDAALLAALSRIESAVVAVQTSVERSAMERRRAAPVAPVAPGTGASGEALSTPGDDARTSSRAVPPAAPPELELNGAAIRALSTRMTEFESVPGADDNEDPRRSDHLRPMRDVIAEFGQPTYCSGREGRITATWSMGDASVSAAFVDGLCVAIYD